MPFTSRRDDAYLVDAIRHGDTQSSAELFNRYKIYSWQIAHEQYAIHRGNGLTLDDYFTAVFDSVAIAVQRYDVAKGKALYPYWKKIALHEIVELIRSQSYSGGARAFAGISLNSSSDEDYLLNEERYGFEEPRVSERSLVDEMFAIIFDSKNKFTPREQQILMCLLDGYTREEIMKILDLKPSIYCYHFKRASNKLKAILALKEEKN